MQTSKLKTYAPKARRDFIAAVTRRAAKLGLTAKGASPIREEGQLVFIEGQPYPKSVGVQRQKLAVRIRRQGFQQVVEAAAYTWFNRFAAIRYMELHGHLDHSFRVLSHPAGGALPEILEQAQHVDLPGLDRQRVIDLKMDGTRDEELYRDLLLAQCHALHQAMPFLFERVDDETELLLPDNLLQTDSLIRELVSAIPEADWQEIEIVGWLYQFYISEKKDQVIGKVVASEDIPAATQLLTPNWIVKYMVESSLGAQWLATYPQSPLKGQMEYYIEPAEQTDEVKAQLAAITPSQLNPEELTLIDPASGSGHILVEAYELLKAIYLERGYRLRDIPRLILKKNLFGLDIDGRAAQLAGFALMMKARADDRRLFERGVKVNVMVLVESKDLGADELARALQAVVGRVSPQGVTRQFPAGFDDNDLFSGTPPQKSLGESAAAESSGYAALTRPTIAALIDTFADAKTFGSLIQIPPKLATVLPDLRAGLSQAWESGDVFARAAAERLLPLVQQAEMPAAQYDAVVANPPYMGSKGMNALVKKFAKDHFPDARTDLFACFTERAVKGTAQRGRVGIVAPYVWMSLSSHEKLREKILDETSLSSLIQLEYNAFEPAWIPIAGFTLMHCHVPGIAGSYIKLSEFKGHRNQAPRTLEAIRNPECGWFFVAAQDEFKTIPTSPVAHWASEQIREAFASYDSLGLYFETRLGMSTANNDAFVRYWFEVDHDAIHFSAHNREHALAHRSRWFPYQKGRSFRKWYGNNYLVVDWENDGVRIRNFGSETGKVRSHNYNLEYIFRQGLTWTDLTSARNAFRIVDKGYLFDGRGSSGFSTGTLPDIPLLAFFNSDLCFVFLNIINPTFSTNVNEIQKLPISPALETRADDFLLFADRCVEYARGDWNAYERSWDFQSLPILSSSSDPTTTLESSYTAWIKQNRDTIAEMKRLEEENNRLFVDAYGLADELTPDVSIEQITLTENPAYRYGGKVSEEEQWTRFRQDTMQELVSYAIGCMMGRYSLDAPGLIYAHSGNEGFDPSRYPTFPADDDGIVPLTDTEWFDDDAAHRLIEFISVAWDKAHVEENLKFLADNLSPKKDESSRGTIRRYLSDGFFKVHLQTYKNRPIDWCFTSGKQKAFQCLVYLHRYNEGIPAHMRMEYVVPLQSKLAARIDKLTDDIQSASTSAQAKRLQKERDKLTRQLDELRHFDEQLRHYADQRIALDLDDGVKVNYGKFGALLAEVKAVAGQKSGVSRRIISLTQRRSDAARDPESIAPSPHCMSLVVHNANFNTYQEVAWTTESA